MLGFSTQSFVGVLVETTWPGEMWSATPPRAFSHRVHVSWSQCRLLALCSGTRQRVCPMLHCVADDASDRALRMWPASGVTADLVREKPGTARGFSIRGPSLPPGESRTASKSGPSGSVARCSLRPIRIEAQQTGRRLGGRLRMFWGVPALRRKICVVAG